MKIGGDKKAVSEVIGTILLLGIAVTLFSVLYIAVFSHTVTPSTPSVNIAATVDGNNIILEHRGGEPLGLDTQITIIINDDVETTTVGENLDEKSKEDDLWRIGEKMYYTFDQNQGYSEAKIIVNDVVSNSLVMMGVLPLPPESDIEIMLTVDDPNPVVGDEIKITITANNHIICPRYNFPCSF